MPIGTQNKDFTQAWLLKLLTLLDERNGFDSWGQDLTPAQIDTLNDMDMQLLGIERKAARLVRELKEVP